MTQGSLIVTHGGVGAPQETSDGTDRAASAARAVMASGGSAIGAAVAAVEVLEADGRYCAGNGSSIRLDGHTVEQDAALHTSTGIFAAVAAVSGVPNPIRVVERLAETPASFLAGEGARRFAERHGLTGSISPTARARERFARVAAHAAAGTLHEMYGPWRGVDLAECWNFARPIPDYRALAAGDAHGGEAHRGDDAHRGDGPGDRTDAGSDTVGAVIFDPGGSDEADGRNPRFVAAVSTGGTSIMLMGRVGDSPLLGCGLYAGPAGAVTVTGVGEEIIRRMLSKWIYDRLDAGADPEAACRAGVGRFPAGIQAGAIAATATGHGHAATHEMPVGIERG